MLTIDEARKLADDAGQACMRGQLMPFYQMQISMLLDLVEFQEARITEAYEKGHAAAALREEAAYDMGYAAGLTRLEKIVAGALLEQNEGGPPFKVGTVKVTVTEEVEDEEDVSESERPAAKKEA